MKKPFTSNAPLPLTTSLPTGLLLIAANVLLGIGLRAPALTLEPRFGELTSAVTLFSPGFGATQEISVLSGLALLWNNGDRLFAAALFLFSVIFPVAKLGVMWTAWWSVMHHGGVPPSLRRLEFLGKYSLLDVFVLALVAVTFKSLPGGSFVRIEPGLFAFGGSGLLAYSVPKRLEQVHTTSP